MVWGLKGFAGRGQGVQFPRPSNFEESRAGRAGDCSIVAFRPLELNVGNLDKHRGRWKLPPEAAVSEPDPNGFHFEGSYGYDDFCTLDFK